MPFFERPPEDRQPNPPAPQRVPWRGDSSDTVGVPVPYARVLARTEDAAVLVSGIVVYPAGFSLHISAVARMDHQQIFGPFDYGLPSRFQQLGDDRPSTILRFGMQFADGSKVMSLDPASQRLTPGPGGRTRMLMHRGGRGASRKWTQSFWCGPLPPDGPLAFVVEWPQFDITETQTEVDAAMILDAARDAVPIWPDDVGLTTEPATDDVAQGSPFHFTVGREAHARDDDSEE